MADTLPSPPASRSTTPDADEHDTNDLVGRLDELLEQYLELLDQYTILREELSKTFSAGFLSLAHAQRASTLGAGRRYGQDCYDERMKAQRRVKTKSEEKEGTLEVEVVRHVPPKEEEKVVRQDETTNHGEVEAANNQEDKQDVQKKQAVKYGEQNNSTPRSKQDPGFRDPATWFGILVPPALRQTQGHFVRAVENSLPQLLAVDARMRGLEDQIWGLRDKLGLTRDYESVSVGAVKDQVRLEAVTSTQQLK